MAVKKSAKREVRKKIATKKSAGRNGRATAMKNSSRKKAARKKNSAVKAAGRKKSGARRGPGRPPGASSKTRGSAASRRLIGQIAQRILEESNGCSREEASAKTGAHVDDIKNLKAGNHPSLKLILRIIREGRFDPNVLIHDLEFKKLPASTSISGARSALISARIRKLAKEHEPAALAEKTGLSIYTIYQHRVADKRVGLHTILAFIDAGAATAGHIFLGVR